jgi:subtilase family serine protease
MGNIFNASNNGSIQYGQRCDQEFMKLGLRGITFLFSSGDDGIGGTTILANMRHFVMLLRCEFTCSLQNT